jgi:hypothetical protein
MLRILSLLSFPPNILERFCSRARRLLLERRYAVEATMFTQNNLTLGGNQLANRMRAITERR